MAAGKFHINEKGAVTRCHAEHKCPFGGESGFDNHFESVKEAREAFEAKNKAQEVPQQLKKQAAPRVEEQPLATRIATGEAILANLREAHNTAQGPEVTRLAREIAKTSAHLQALKEQQAAQEKPAKKAAPKPKKAAATPARKKAAPAKKAAAKPAPQQNPWEKAEEDLQVAINDYKAQGFVYPDKAKELLQDQRHGAALAVEMLKNRKQPMTEDLAKTIAEKTAYKQFSQEEVEAMGPRAVSIMGYASLNQQCNFASKATDPMVHEALYQRVKREETEPFDREYISVSLVKNPAVSSAYKESLGQMNSTAASVYHLQKLEDETPGRLEGLLKGRQAPTRGKTETYKFDPEELESLGIEPRDVNNLVGHFYGNHLFGGSYDAKTGVYRGYRD